MPTTPKDIHYGRPLVPWVFNRAKVDQDFEIRGATLSALLYSDASTDRIGIGTASPSALLHVNGAFRATGATIDNLLTITAGGLTVTAGGLTVTAGGATITAGGLRVTAGRIVENMSVNDITTAGAGTYTAAQLAGGIITRDPNGAGRVDTTDTAANIIAGTPALSSDGDTLLCWVINTADAAEAITLAGGTGVTVSNVGQTIAQNKSALLLFRRTGAAALTLYIIGA